MKPRKVLENDCRICETNEFFHSCSKGEFKYVTCTNCGVTRQYPYPSTKSVNEFYDQYLLVKNHENPIYLSDESWDNFKREKDFTLKDLNFSTKEFSGKKILDIGCATGLFVKYVNQYGGQGYGIDISAQLIDIAQKRNLNCQHKDLFSVKEKFDIINISHVIEHVDQPIKYLEFISTILKKNGFLLIETPCTGVISESFAENWRFFMPIEHLHLFSQDNLFKTLVKNNFSITNWIRFGSGNTTGTINQVSKKAADNIAKKLGIGDIISVLCQKK